MYSISYHMALVRCDAICAEIDYLIIYDNTPPDNAQAALSQHATNNPLVTVTLNTPSYNNATMVGDEAVATLNLSPSNPSGTVTTGGTASFYRSFNSSNAVLTQGDVTVTGGDGNLKLSSLTLSVNDTVEVTS